MARKNTKALIVEKALEMFNELGAWKTTTNHIAEAMEISPGNLYYHFRNKEEIIRAIFNNITEDFSPLWDVREGDENSIASIAAMFSGLIDLYYKYRFFYLEINTLIAQDAELREMYSSNLERRFLQQKKFYSRMIESNYISFPGGDEEFDRVLTSAWIISDFWVTFLHITNQDITRDAIALCIPHLIQIMRPYLTTEAENDLERLSIP